MSNPETMTVDQALELVDSTVSDIQEMQRAIKAMKPERQQGADTGGEEET